MKVLQIHNQYHFKGGEDIVVENEKKLLKSNGHIVDQLFRSNKIEIKSKFDQLKVLKNLNIFNKVKKYIKKKKLINSNQILFMFTIRFLYGHTQYLTF